MKKNIFYWSPCLNPVGTIKSTINSATSLKQFNKDYNVSIINVCGEWDEYRETIDENSINKKGYQMEKNEFNITNI